MPMIKISVWAEKREIGYQVIATFSDGRNALKGPIESFDESDQRILNVATAINEAMMESIRNGDEASFSISAKRVEPDGIPA